MAELSEMTKYDNVAKFPGLHDSIRTEECYFIILRGQYSVSAQGLHVIKHWRLFGVCNNLLFSTDLSARKLSGMRNTLTCIVFERHHFLLLKKGLLFRTQKQTMIHIPFV